MAGKMAFSALRCSRTQCTLRSGAPEPPFSAHPEPNPGRARMAGKIAFSVLRCSRTQCTLRSGAPEPPFSARPEPNPGRARMACKWRFLRSGAHVPNVRSAPVLQNHHFRLVLNRIRVELDGRQDSVFCAPVLTYSMYAPLRCSKTTIFGSSCTGCGSSSTARKMAFFCAPVLTYSMYAPLRCSRTTIFGSS
jgi:hypothetical protein